MSDIERLLLRLSASLSEDFSINSAREVRRQLDAVRNRVPFPPPDTIEQTPLRNLFDYLELKSHDAVLGRTQWLRGELADIDRELLVALAESQRVGLTEHDIEEIDNLLWELRDRVDTFGPMEDGRWPLQCLIAYVDAKIKRSLETN
ncbi:hypothetical protein IU479_14180 [Nocardia abscessus]|uniref:hypothetical protein n=1 Tax=Nocardia TaxID=1817 RepID=UPI001893819D|nr:MULTISPECIES: hypothetical protein [Nocardia]MBF6219259.1 hypothetical protein [Nocardia abscessus]MDE1669154.1 hypothetical protein [Nocardia gipuzkoensis]